MYASRSGDTLPALAARYFESMAVAIDWGPFSSAYKDAIALVVLLLILLVRSGRLAAEERAG